ncbi:MAG: glycohydrolase toxin TNT-related protein [Bacteroidia bacterium]|nr:glycohydrolase toxin TNT-related protein [Bacteroidia bacterium]
MNLRKNIFSFLNSLLLCFVLFLFSSITKAQVYPVQVSTQLIPPYSGYLPDYTDPSSEKLKIILQFNDFLTPQYNIKLKLEIKGNGFTIVTKQLFNPPPIVLQPGIPTIISGVDLAPYLNSSNLDFIGINQAQYENRMALPEGFYSICVTAYDYYNPGKIQVSNQSCSNAWFTLSNPPFLNLPLCSKNITPQVPQNIVFQWTPVNIGSPNSATSTEYDFELWEVRPDSSVNPNQIVLSTAPIYSTTTNLTLINYGIAEPPLNLYMKYVWRVRARDLSGRDWFKNNGYSQICTFVYGNLSSVLGNALNLTLNANGITHRMGHCTWNTQSIYTNYKLQVRKQGTQNWFDYNTSGNFEKVNNLEPNTDYEARVRGEGSALTGDWSNVASFRTLSEPVYGCGDQTFTPDAFQAQALPISKAVPGLIIQSGQFEVKASQITPNGPQGWYSGKGTAEVYGFPIAVKFNNIYIDDNNRHQQGIIEALTEGITAWTQQWDKEFAEANPSVVPGKIDSIWVSGNQICVKIQGDDSCFTMPPNQNIVVVRDGEGNQYNVQTTPPPPKITGPFNYITYGNDNIDAKDSCIVHFEQSSNQQFGFDKKQYAAWLNNYETIKLNNGKTYYVPYKSIGENANDKVKANITIKPFDENKLSFKTRGGQTCVHTPAGANSYEVTVPADAGCVYAYYDAKKIGKLNVVTLKQQNRKLVLVPVNNAALGVSNVQSELNKLFRQANVNWSVTTKSSFNFNLGNDGLEEADANLLSKYSTEMRALRDAYKSHDSLYDKEAYYIFVVSNFRDPSIKGYMVRGRGLGFVAANASIKHLAHELAHGAFGLEHTFPAIAQNTSNNLMDYKEQGVELSAMQWEEMHSSQMLFNWFDTEEDAALSEADFAKWLQNIIGLNCYNTYKNYNGIIPECTWNNNILNAMPDGGYGCAFACGILDGVFLTIKDAVNLVDLINCWTPLGYNTTTSGCALTREKTIETIKLVREICGSSEGYKKIYNELAKSLGGWANSTFCGDRTCAYNQGKLVFDIVSLFYGVGEVKAALSTGMAGAKIAKIIAEVDKTAVAVSKAFTSVSKSVIKTAAGLQLCLKLNGNPNFVLATIDVTKKAIKFNNAELPSSVQGTIIGKLDNVTYVEDITGAVKKGDIEIVQYDAGNNTVVAGYRKAINKIYKNVTYEDFSKTISNATNAQTHLAYQLWGENKWNELYGLFTNNNINVYEGIIYPPFDGFISKTKNKIPVNFEIDRRGGEIINGQFIDGGSFVSKKGASFTSRSLPQSALSKPLKKYKVIKEIPNVDEGAAIPWFGEAGLGTQYKLPYSIDYLKSNGYIVEIP